MKYLFLLSTLFLFSSCADKGDYQYNQEYVKELYEATFPVKDIDPNQDWKTTSVVKLNVTVNEDALETYKVKVYDAFPLDSENPANRLAMGTVENGKSILLQFDCPTALDSLWIVRVDRANRRAAQMIAIEDKSAITDVTIGAVSEDSRAYKENNGYQIVEVNAPYTRQDINSMLSTALEVESGKALGQSYGIISKTDVYKLTKNGNNFNLLYDGSDKNCILIVTTEWTPNGTINVGGSNLTIVVADGGKINGSLSITNSSNLVVLQGGTIQGGNITLTNASGGKINYNGGTLAANTLTITSGDGILYNAGTLNIDNYVATNNGTTLTNMGQCSIKTLTAGNANIENGCYMKINGDCSATNLIVADGAVLECGSFCANKRWQNMVTKIGANAMIDCKGTLYVESKIYGPNNKKALFKVKEVFSNLFVDSWQYFAKNVQFEVDRFLSGMLTLSKITTGGSSISWFGESNVTIPSGSCTGDGNTPGQGGDSDDEKSPTYTCCYEDYYPVPGDYDFNDIVMDMSYELTRNNDNKITNCKLNIQLTAVGATYTIGSALQLVGIDKANIGNVTVDNADLTVGNMFGSYAEESAAGNYAVVPLFNDAHHAISGQNVNRYMYNTAQGH